MIFHQADLRFIEFSHHRIVTRGPMICTQDLLYFPRGTVHSGIAEEQSSCHMKTELKKCAENDGSHDEYVKIDRFA